MYCIFLFVGWYRSEIELTNVNIVADLQLKGSKY